MKRKLFLLAIPVALAALLAAPAISEAQRFGLGVGRGGVSFGSGPGWGGYGSGYGWGGPAYGGGGHGYGWGNTYGGLGWGSGYGLGGHGYGLGSGYYSPGYYGSGYGHLAPGYYSSAPSYYSGSGQVAGGIQQTGYQSFYPPSGDMMGQQDPSRAYVHVMVPANAEVLFENTPTQQRGPERMFVTPQLEQGHRYSYTITARWQDQNGKTVNRTKTVSLEPGRTVHAQFIEPGDQQFQQPGQRYDGDQQFQRRDGQPQGGTQTDINRTDINRTDVNVNPGTRTDINVNPGTQPNRTTPAPATQPNRDNPNPGTQPNRNTTNPDTPPRNPEKTPPPQ